LFAWHVLALE
jgi:hypothetical protein